MFQRSIVRVNENLINMKKHGMTWRFGNMCWSMTSQRLMIWLPRFMNCLQCYVSFIQCFVATAGQTSFATSVNFRCSTTKKKTFSLTNVKASSLIIINLYLWGGRGVKYFFPSGCAFDRKMIQSSVVIMEEKVKSERWHPFQYRCAQIII